MNFFLNLYDGFQDLNPTTYWDPSGYVQHPQKVMNLLNFHEFPLCTVVQLSNSTASYLFLNEVY